MSARPIRFCICGEYVADGSRFIASTRTTVPCLIHIDADGVTIHRNHKPIEENELTRGASVNRLAQLRQEGKIP